MDAARFSRRGLAATAIGGVGIEHRAPGSTVHLVNNKVVSTTVGVRAGDSCWVDIDSYRGYGAARFARLPGATDTEDDLVRHVMTHPLA